MARVANKPPEKDDVPPSKKSRTEEPGSASSVAQASTPAQKATADVAASYGGGDDEMDSLPELSDEEFIRRHRHAEQVEAAAERDRLRALHLELYRDVGDQGLQKPAPQPLSLPRQEEPAPQLHSLHQVPKQPPPHAAPQEMALVEEVAAGAGKEQGY